MVGPVQVRVVVPQVRVDPLVGVAMETLAWGVLAILLLMLNGG